MAITTLNGVIAGARPPEDLFRTAFVPRAAAVWHSLAYQAGVPAAAATPTPGLAGAALTSYAGQIPFANPTGTNQTYLSRLVVSSAAVGLFRVYDRLWHNSGIVPGTLTAQTVDSVAWPARDRNGSVDGVGVGLALEVSALTGNAGLISTITVSYTNSAGVSARTASIPSFQSSSVAGTAYLFNLQAGDVGVRSVQSVTLGTSLVSGTVQLVAYRSLVNLSVPAPNNPVEVNAVTGGFPRLYDNTVPFTMWMPNNTNTHVLSAQLYYAQG